MAKNTWDKQLKKVALAHTFTPWLLGPAAFMLKWYTGEGGVSAFKVFNNNVKIQGLQDWECDSFPDLPDIFKDLGTMPSITKQ